MNLTDGLTEHLRDLTPPHPDLDRVVQQGRRRRRTRLTAQVAAAVLVAGALGGTALTLRGGGTDKVGDPPFATAPLDLSHGLRAYADPGGQGRMGGRSFSAKDLEQLDTDAAATDQGIVFFQDGRPFLLGESGKPQQLWSGPVDDPGGWHPTAKNDATTPAVAFAVRHGQEVTLVVRDLDTTATVSLPVDCEGPSGCDKLVVEGIDSGHVFVRTSAGTFVWRYTAGAGGDRLEPFAGPRTRVADVRSRTVLYDGPRPTVTLAGWRYVAGAIDAQLTFDGSHVLYWSPDLKPVEAGGSTIHLDVPKGTQFFTVDTDGSILAATTGDRARFFDCEVPSGTCEPIGALRMTGGDPMFIGNDM